MPVFAGHGCIVFSLDSVPKTAPDPFFFPVIYGKLHGLLPRNTMLKCHRTKQTTNIEARNMGTFFVVLLVSLIFGAVIGLVPFFVGRYMRKPELGQLGMLCCAISALLHLSLPILLAIAFTISIFLVKQDIRIPGRGGSLPPPEPGFPQSGALPSGSLNLVCLSGPLKGRAYRIGANGLTFGRDGSCAVRFPANAPGISRLHCCIRWQQGQPVLVDLNSAYGTFLGDGRQLPPNYPMQLAAGSSFFLGGSENRFQITTI